MKKYGRTYIYDTLHKGGVLACMGMTLYGSIMLAQFGYNYFMNVKPELKAKQEILQIELLKEGASDAMIDKAQNLKL